MKVALVTGASRGLGAEIAKFLAKDGWKVAVNYAHDQNGAEAVVGAIAASGGGALAVNFDVTNAEAVTAGIAKVTEELGPIDLVVNNATGPQANFAIADQTWDHYQRHFEFFVKAPLLSLQVLLPQWRARGTGRVINIGSEVVAIGNAYYADYVSAKAAMVGLTRSWASELGPEGITVNLIAPGWIPVERHEGTPEEDYARYTKSVPLARMGKPSDIAAMVAFIASSAADYITGQTISVNGGRTFS
jgi:3-oxoacyl-[acyl-carrier protein] reductase